MKLQGFTIVELLVVLIISSGVMLLGVYGWIQFEKLSMQMQQHQNGMKEINSLNFVLTHDVQKASTIEGDSTNIVLEIENTTIDYYFLDTLVIRTTPETSDSFSFSHQATCFYSPSTQLINKITLQISTQNRQFIRSFEKWYDAQTLMSNEP